jgi:mRNA-degrading endonuclease toxin of MazEF toxin-antitoxin module
MKKLMVSSKLSFKRGDDVGFDAERAGLSAVSVIRMAKIATIEQDRVVRVIGTVDKKTKEAVARTLLKFTT